MENTTTIESLEEENAEYIFDRLYVRLIFIALYTIVFCSCFFGNLIVILVVTLHWRMRNVTKFCLANLAVADLCVGVFCVYQNLSTYLISSWVLGEFMCKMYHFINSLSHTSSILIIVVMCVERYLAILHPLRCNRILTLSRLRIVMVGVWLCSAIYCAPKFYYIATVTTRRNDGSKEIICTAKRTLYNSKTFDMIHFVLLFLLPLLVITVLYTRVGIILWQGAKSRPSWAAAFNTAINSPPSVSIQQCNPIGNEASYCSSPDTPEAQISRARVCSKHPNVHCDCGFNESDELSSNSNSSSQNEEEDKDDQILVVTEIARKSQVASSVSASVSARNGNAHMSSISITDERGACTNRNQNQLHVKMDHNASGHSHSNFTELGRINVRDGREGGFDSNSAAPPSRCQLTRQNCRRRIGPIKSRQTVVKMLIVIVVTFFLCNLPFHVRKVCQYWWPNYNYVSVFNALATPLTHLIMYANCALNPIIYAFMSKTFRASLKELILFRWRKQPTVTSSHYDPPTQSVSLRSTRQH